MLALQFCGRRTHIRGVDGDGLDGFQTLILQGVAPLHIHPGGFLCVFGPAQEENIPALHFPAQGFFPIVAAAQAVDIEEDVHIRAGFFHTLDQTTHTGAILAGVRDEGRQHVAAQYFHTLLVLGLQPHGHHQPGGGDAVKVDGGFQKDLPLGGVRGNVQSKVEAEVATIPGFFRGIVQDLHIRRGQHHLDPGIFLDLVDAGFLFLHGAFAHFQRFVHRVAEGLLVHIQLYQGVLTLHSLLGCDRGKLHFVYPHRFFGRQGDAGIGFRQVDRGIFHRGCPGGRRHGGDGRAIVISQEHRGSCRRRRWGDGPHRRLQNGGFTISVGLEAGCPGSGCGGSGRYGPLRGGIGPGRRRRRVDEMITTGDYESIPGIQLGQQPGQGKGEALEVRITLGRLVAASFFHNRAQGFRIETFQTEAVALNTLLGRFVGGVPVGQRQPALIEQAVKQNAQRIDIRSLGICFLVENFRRHISRGAPQLFHLGNFPQGNGGTKVSQLHHAGGGDQQIARLKIHVGNAVLITLDRRLASAMDQLYRNQRGDLPAAAIFFHRLDVFLHQVEHIAIGFPGDLPGQRPGDPGIAGQLLQHGVFPHGVIELGGIFPAGGALKNRSAKTVHIADRAGGQELGISQQAGGEGRRDGSQRVPGGFGLIFQGLEEAFFLLWGFRFCLPAEDGMGA